MPNLAVAVIGQCAHGERTANVIRVSQVGGLGDRRMGCQSPPIASCAPHSYPPLNRGVSCNMNMIATTIAAAINNAKTRFSRIR
jgi:hypothetical protein